MRVAFVGGGYASCLAATALKLRKVPNLEVVIYEKESQMNPHQTWCFHETDLCPGPLSKWLKAQADFVWSHQTVQFPKFERTLQHPYYCIRSAKFAEKMKHHLQEELRYGNTVKSTTSHTVTLENGTEESFDLVLNGTGLSSYADEQTAYQKFLGLVVSFTEDIPFESPIIMDATIPQKDGYRFMYVLPFSSRKALVEDTRYSLSPEIDESEYKNEIVDYLSSKGCIIENIEGMEKAALPIPLLSAALPQQLHSIGLAGGLFHATTGYSTCEAVAFADWLSRNISSPDLHHEIRQYRERVWGKYSFFRRLNNMLFLAAKSDSMYKVLQKFYELPDETICRFYRGDLHGLDKVRLLTGKPPVPISKGLYYFFTHGVTNAYA